MSINFHSSINTLKERGILKVCFQPKSQYDKFQINEFHGDVTLSYQISTFLLNYKPFFTPHLLTELRSLSSSNKILSDFFELFEIHSFISDEEVQVYSTKFQADVIEAMISELSQSIDSDAQLLLKSIVGFLIGWGERDFNVKYPHIIEEGILKKPKSSNDKDNHHKDNHHSSTSQQPKAFVSYVVSQQHQQSSSKKSGNPNSTSSSSNINNNNNNNNNSSYKQTQQNYENFVKQHKQNQSIIKQQQQQQQQQNQKQHQQIKVEDDEDFGDLPLLTPASIDSCKFKPNKSKENSIVYDGFGESKKQEYQFKKDSTKKELVPFFNCDGYNSSNGHQSSTETAVKSIINLLDSTTLDSNCIKENTILLSPYTLDLALKAQPQQRFG